MKSFELVLLSHPDKACDYIAEKVAELYRNNLNATHTSIEVAWFGSKMIIGGEHNGAIHNRLYIEHYVINLLVSDLLVELPSDFEIEVLTHQQSAEIAALVGEDTGAGDNGIFFAGYSAKWSPIVSKLKAIAKALSPRMLKEFGYKSDGKFIAEFDDDGTLKKFTLNVASYECRRKDRFYDFVFATIGKIFIEWIGAAYAGRTGLLFINPKGDWQNCWGFADAGLSGRKLACDYQCGLFPIGGGAIFGKDNTKADRSVNAYLYVKAKEMEQIIDDGMGTIKLHASTIIGDDEVEIWRTATGELVEVAKFADIVKLMDTKYEIDIFGEITEVAK
jgi:S-adenosylmethionine synthetase